MVALAASALLLIGCAPTTSAEPSAAPSSASSSPSPSPSPTPEIDPAIVVSLEDLTVTDASGTTSASFDDSTALLALLEKTTGELPEPETVEIFPGEPSTLQRYEWDGLTVVADSAVEGPARVRITAEEIGGMPITTTEGLHVGSTRAELLEVDAWALVDEEDAATAEYLGLGRKEVPGTESLTHPGSVGVQYMLFTLAGDTVTQFNAPADDFSDL